MTVPKLSLELAPGKRLGAIALMEMMACTYLDSVAVVVRDNDELRWMPGPEELNERTSKLKVVTCSQAPLGMSYSIREGLQAVLPSDPQAIIVVLADQPFITAKLLDRLANAYAENRTLDYVACACGPISMPPALFAPSTFNALDRLHGDAGARKLFVSSDYQGERVEVDSDYTFADVDSPSDLERARRYWAEWIRASGSSGNIRASVVSDS